MELPRPSRQSLLALGALIVAAAAAFLYYNVRIRASRDYLTQRNFRVLASAGRQVVGSLDSVTRMLDADLKQVLADTGREVEYDPACGQPPDAGACPLRQLEAGLCTRVGKSLKQALALRRCLVNEDVGRRALPQIDFIDYTIEGKQTGACPDPSPDPSPLRTQITLAGGGDAMMCARRRASGFAVEGVARAKLAPLLEPFLVKDVFETVLLLGEDGRVLMVALTDLQVRRLPYGKPSAMAAAASEGSKPDEEPAKKGEDKPGPKKEAQDPTRVPSVERMEVAGHPYLAFCQPLELAGTRPAAAALCGLTAADRFQAESVQLNPYWLVALTASLVLGALSWPLLKIVFVGAGERVRVFDLVFLGLSLLMGTGLLTLLSLDLAAGFEEMKPFAHDPGRASGDAEGPVPAWQVDRHLATLGEEIRRGIEEEMGDARESLGELAKVPDDILLRYRRLADWSIDLKLLEDKEKPHPAAEVLEKLRYPTPQTVAWVDAAGQQLVKWSTQKYRAPLHDVGDREYFVNAKNNRLWHHDQMPWFGEVVRSRSTAEPLLVLSTRLDLEEHKALPVAVVTLAARAVSAVGALLPPGYGFALLDADGRIVLHSEDRHATDENFLEETDGSPALRAALFSRTRALFDATYWGQPHRILSLPLETAPWTLAVFYESDRSRTVHLETLTLAFFLLLTLLVLLGFWVTVGRFVAGAGNRPWLWPQHRGTVRYPGLAGFFLVVSGLTLALSRSTPAPAFLLPLAAAGIATVVMAPAIRLSRRLAAGAFLAGVPLVAFAAHHRNAPAIVVALVVLGAALALARRPGAFSLRWPRFAISPRLAYVAWVLTAIFVFSVAPAASFYRLATDRYTNLSVLHALLDMARRLDGHPLGPASLPHSGGRSLGGYRFFYGGDLVEDPVPLRGTACSSGSPTDPLPTVADSVVPVYNPHSIRLRGSGGARAADGGWSSGSLADGGRCLAFRGTESGMSYLLVSRAAIPARFASWAFAGLLPTGFAVALLLRHLSRRLFLLDFKDPETLSLAELAEGPIQSNLLVVCAPLSRKEKLLARPDLLLVDLQGANRSAVDVALLLQQHPRPRILCFDRFEVALQSAGQRRALLAGLELAVGIPGPPLVLLAETDPEPALGLEGAARAAEGTPDAEMRRRWAQLLGHFVRVIAVDRGEPEAFAQDVARAEKVAEAMATPGALPARAREAFATLRRECMHHHALQEVARVLLQNPEFPSYDRDRVARHVRELADSYYRGLWLSLPDAQKLLLHQIADGDLVSLRAGRALSRLLALRLVVRDPDVRIVNASFARFVDTATTPEQVRAWQRSEAPSVWAHLRAPVLITLVAVAGLLVYSQPDTLLGVLTSVGAVIPILAKLLDLLRSQKAAAPASSG